MAPSFRHEAREPALPTMGMEPEHLTKGSLGLGSCLGAPGLEGVLWRKTVVILKVTILNWQTQNIVKPEFPTGI